MRGEVITSVGAALMVVGGVWALMLFAAGPPMAWLVGTAFASLGVLLVALGVGIGASERASRHNDRDAEVDREV
jgi:hypothetical protein